MLSMHRLSWTHSYRKDERLHGSFVALISGDGVEVSGSNAQSKFEWGAFQRLTETKDLFLLYQGPNAFNVLPKKYFGPGEADAFRSLVEQRLGKSNRKLRKNVGPLVWVFVVIVSVSLVLLVRTIRNVLRQTSPHPSPVEQSRMLK